MSHSRRILIIATTLFAISNALLGQVWKRTNGPEGGRVNAVACAPNGSLFASTANDIFRSTDNGNHWSRLAGIKVGALTVNSGGDVFVSHDGVARSTDNGETWQPFSDIWGSGVLCFNDEMFIATSYGDVLRTVDDGRNWTQISNRSSYPCNLPCKYGELLCAGIDAHGNLLLGVGFERGSRPPTWFVSNVLCSSDSGRHWLSTELSYGSLVRFFVASRDSLILAGHAEGLIQTTNYGSTWETILANVGVKAAAIDSNGYFFAATDGGDMQRSTDRGESWNLANEGMPSPVKFTCFAVAGGASPSIFAGTWTANGIMRTMDHGDSWNFANNGLVSSNVQAIVVNSHGAYFTGSDGVGVSRSTDGGENWTQVVDPKRTSYVSAVAIDSNDQLFYVDQNGLYRSTDNGDSWKTLTTEISSAAALVANPKGILVASKYQKAVYRSTDHGTTWNQALKPPPTTLVTCLAVNPNGDIVAGTEGAGLFHSRDNGDIWEPLGLTESSLTFSAIYVNSDGSMLAGTSSGEIFRSSDNGVTWTMSKVTYWSISSFTANRLGYIFAGTKGGEGVYRSTDQGASWSIINSTGLTLRSVNQIAVDQQGYLLAGTAGSGLFRTVESTSSVREDISTIPPAVTLYQSHPNPASSSTTLSYHTSITSRIKLGIFDVLGHRIAMLVDGNVEAGSHNVDLNVADLQAGFYVCRLIVDNLILNQSFVVVH
jgi:photosystem II stability/assembly factor-like uncharacterized protein